MATKKLKQNIEGKYSLPHFLTKAVCCCGLYAIIKTLQAGFIICETITFATPTLKKLRCT